MSSPSYWYRKLLVVPHSHSTTLGRTWFTSKPTVEINTEKRFRNSSCKKACISSLSGCVLHRPWVLKSPSSRFWLQVCTAVSRSWVHCWNSLSFSSGLFDSSNTDWFRFTMSEKPREFGCYCASLCAAWSAPVNSVPDRIPWRSFRADRGAGAWTVLLIRTNSLFRAL